MIDNIHTYTIKVNGYVDQDDINAASPVILNVDRANESATNLSVCADQSGLIGIIRHLHSMGYVIMSVLVNETF